ncbi:hypothetical protein [Burkholderia perseverans]|uniref:hypothetical protein n=1 Tax=Burkholderia perseverans TaxID=2615214 RepID=UPI001FED35E5|nr:hypothetical protein [Burkholderia perseverans]
MNLDAKLAISLGKRSGNVVLRSELKGLGSPSHLSDALDRQIDRKALVRLGVGVFAKAQPDESGRARLAASHRQILKELFAKLGAESVAITTTHEAGREIFVVDTGAKRIARKIGGKGWVVRYAGQPAQRLSIPDDVTKLPRQAVDQYVQHLARHFGIVHQRSTLDDYAEAVTRAAGDDVTPDLTDKLLIGLKKNNHINARQFAQLTVNHLREKKHV